MGLFTFYWKNRLSSYERVNSLSIHGNLNKCNSTKETAQTVLVKKKSHTSWRLDVQLVCGLFREDECNAKTFLTHYRQIVKSCSKTTLHYDDHMLPLDSISDLGCQDFHLEPIWKSWLLLTTKINKSWSTYFFISLKTYNESSHEISFLRTT